MDNILALVSGLMSVLILIFGSITGIMGILLIVSRWRIFSKLGEKKWKSLIPIYSDYKLYGAVWDSVIYGINLALTIFSSIMLLWSPQRGLEAFGAGFVAWLITLIINIIFNVRLAKSFGKGVGFAIGLILFSPIFMLILAFGKAEYDPDI